MRFDDGPSCTLFSARARSNVTDDRCLPAATTPDHAAGSVSAGLKAHGVLLSFHLRLREAAAEPYTECEIAPRLLERRITPADLEAAIARPTYTALILHEPTCPFSIALEPHVALLQAAYPDIDVLWIPTSALPYLDLRYGVAGTPALLLFRNASVEGRFFGPRNFGDLSSIITSKTRLEPLGPRSPCAAAQHASTASALLAQALPGLARSRADSALSNLHALASLLCPPPRARRDPLVVAAGIYVTLFLAYVAFSSVRGRPIFPW